jgi:hypothetical protein
MGGWRAFRALGASLAARPLRTSGAGLALWTLRPGRALLTIVTRGRSGAADRKRYEHGKEVGSHGRTLPLHLHACGEMGT